MQHPNVSVHTIIPHNYCGIDREVFAFSDGQRIAADIVVANQDVPAAYNLIHNEYGRSRHQDLASKQYSAGVIAFNWCLNRRLDGLLHHNVFLSGTGNDCC